MGVCVVVDANGDETWIDSPSGDTVIVWEREVGGKYTIRGYIKGLIPGRQSPAWSFNGLNYEDEVTYMRHIYDHASTFYCYAGWTMRYLDDTSGNKYIQGYADYLEYLNSVYGIKSFPIEGILPVPQQTPPYPPEEDSPPPVEEEEAPPSEVPVIEPPIEESPVEEPPHEEAPPQENEEPTHTEEPKPDAIKDAVPYIAIAAIGFLLIAGIKLIGRK